VLYVGSRSRNGKREALVVGAVTIVEKKDATPAHTSPSGEEWQGECTFMQSLHK
jgi:hypothetical protein